MATKPVAGKQPCYCGVGEPDDFFCECDDKTGIPPENIVELDVIVDVDAIIDDVDAPQAKKRRTSPRGNDERCKAGRCAASFRLPIDDGLRWCSRCKPPGAVATRASCRACTLRSSSYGDPEAAAAWCSKCKGGDNLDGFWSNIIRGLVVCRCREFSGALERKIQCDLC